MALGTKVIDVPAAGTPGSAAGEARAWLTRGVLRAVDVDFASDQPPTADVTITAAGRNLLTLTNQSADRTVYPRVPVHDARGRGRRGVRAAPVARG